MMIDQTCKSNDVDMMINPTGIRIAGPYFQTNHFNFPACHSTFHSKLPVLDGYPSQDVDPVRCHTIPGALFCA